MGACTARTTYENGCERRAHADRFRHTDPRTHSACTRPSTVLRFGAWRFCAPYALEDDRPKSKMTEDDRSRCGHLRSQMSSSTAASAPGGSRCAETSQDAQDAL